jgi:hypothetical protein
MRNEFYCFELFLAFENELCSEKIYAFYAAKVLHEILAKIYFTHRNYAFLFFMFFLDLSHADFINLNKINKMCFGSQK